MTNSQQQQQQPNRQAIEFDFKPLANPILFVNDAPELYGGLSRIGRDIASLVALMPEFRVGYLGRGSSGHRAYPWMQYSFPESGQWGEDHIEQVWEDFSGGQPGIIMSLWDASRMLWFANPAGTNRRLERFLGPGRNFLKWGYFPVDAQGPNGYSYGTEISAAIQGYDRTLAASEWGYEVLIQSGAQSCDWIPHGIWPDKFNQHPVPLFSARYDRCPTIGCVMANQSRKHWPVAFECAAILQRKIGNKFMFWVHTDRTIGYWNLLALATDYGVADCTLITSNLTDHQLSQYYSTCSATILPTGGEGFGYPIAESMSCGTPCITTDYAAGQEIVDAFYRVRPVAFAIDTQYNIRRAVNSSLEFANRTAETILDMTHDPIGLRKCTKSRVEHLDWNKLKHVWQKWFLKGIGMA